MDLLDGNVARSGKVILLLPGSRKSAGKNAAILLGATEILHRHGHKDFRMVLAPTLDYGKFFASCEICGWRHEGDTLTKGGIVISLTSDDIARASGGVKILLGMGGTANQLCAGMGIPVIAPDDKGKRVQKKLLGNAEILTENTAGAMAYCALRVLDDTELYNFMAGTGRKRMGVDSPGACEDVVRYTREILGWPIREKVYMRLKHSSEGA